MHKVEIAFPRPGALPNIGSNGSWDGLCPITVRGNKAQSTYSAVIMLGTSALGCLRPALGGIHPGLPVLQKYFLSGAVMRIITAFASPLPWRSQYQTSFRSWASIPEAAASVTIVGHCPPPPRRSRRQLICRTPFFGTTRISDNCWGTCCPNTGEPFVCSHGQRFFEYESSELSMGGFMRCRKGLDSHELKVGL